MRPEHSEYPPYFEAYISKVEGEDIQSILSDSPENLQQELAAIPDSQADFRYAPGKWSIREMLQHCIDTERIFAYRALCLSRGEPQPLPGFDQDLYIQNIDISNRSLPSLKEELLWVRRTTVQLFTPLGPKELSRTGIIGGNTVSVLSLGFIIMGHWLHHRDLLRKILVNGS